MNTLQGNMQMFPWKFVNKQAGKVVGNIIIK